MSNLQPITFIGEIFETKRMKTHKNIRVVIEICGNHSTARMAGLLSANEMNETLFEVTLKPVEQKEAPKSLVSDSLSHKWSTLAKEYCWLRGRSMGDFIRSSQKYFLETYGMEHFRELSQETKEKEIEMLQKKIDKITLPQD